MQRYLYEHFQLPGPTDFFARYLLLSLIRLILGHQLRVNITGFMPLKQKQL